MEEFDDDDFSDLYADVEVQASSAISAMHGLTEMTLEKDGILGNAIDRFPELPSKDEEFFENVNVGEEMNGFSEVDLAAKNGDVNVNGDEDGEGEEGGMTKLPVENGDIYESGEDLNIVLNDGNDGNRQKINDYYDNNNNNYKNSGEFGGTNGRKYEGGEEYKEEEENGEGITGNEKSLNSGACHSQRKYMKPHSGSLSSCFKGNGSVRCGQLMDGSPVIRRSGDNFCLPRSRTILDVNIYSLERKPWRHPGANGTDFFNFGFDEDGWKHYCNDVDLKTDYSDTEKKTVYQMFNQVHGPSKNGGADIGGDRDLLHFSSASEDDPPSLRRNDEGRVKIATESYSRHTPACDPVPLDLDKYGSVQISDSEEDNHHEMSDCDSDGGAEAMETSDDMNRRNSSGISNKVSSRVDPESSLGEQSQHGPGFSCSPSPCAALSYDVENIRRHSKKPLSSSESSVSELRESVTCDYHSSKDSKNHGVKPNTRDGRYCERDKGPYEKESTQCRRSNHLSKLKTNLNDENAYNAIDVKGLYDMYQSTISYTKQSAMLSFDSNEKDMPYCNKGPGSFFSYFGGLFPDYHLGPAYLSKQKWNNHQRFGYEAGWCDGHNINGKLNVLKKKRTELDYETFEDDWYNNERRHDVQDTNPVKFEESRKLIPKYSYAMNGRGAQFSEKGDALQFMRKSRRGKMSPLHEYNNNFIKGKYRRYIPCGDRERDHLDHRYDQNTPWDRREMESPGRGKRRCDSPLNGFDNSWYVYNEYNGSRHIKRHPLPFHSYKESHISWRGQFQGAAGLKSGVLEKPVRNMRFSWKERHRESRLDGSHAEDHLVRRRHYQQYTNTVNMNKSIKYHHNKEHFVRRRHYQLPEVLHLNGEDYKSRWQDGTGIMFHSEGPSYKCERISRNRRPNDGHALDRVAEVVDEGEVHKRKYKLIREGNCSSQFFQSSNFSHPDNHVQMNSRYGDSVDPCSVVVRKECTRTLQSSRRNSEAVDAVYYGGYDFMESNDDRKPENVSGLIDINPDKAVLTNEGKLNINQSHKSCHKNLSGNQQNKFMDIEEGQIITEEINEKHSECVIASEDVVQINHMEHPKSASNGNNAVEGLDDQRIQEIMAKMEKRRERFKEPITLNSFSEKTSKLFPDLNVKAAEGKLGRPARKRRWVGN